MDDGTDSTTWQLKMPPLTTDLEGKEIEALIGPTNRFNNGQLVWLVKFKSASNNCVCDLVPSTLMNQYFPQSVIKFFERRIRILHRQKDSEMPARSSAVVIPDRDRANNVKKAKKKKENSKKIVQKSKPFSVPVKPKQYKCQECGSSFRRCDYLSNHRRIHSDLKPFKCPQPLCEKKFRTKGNMRSHLVMHSDLSPFPCSYAKCGKSFKRKSNLKEHLQWHSGQ